MSALRGKLIDALKPMLKPYAPKRTEEEQYYFDTAKAQAEDGVLEVDDDAVVSLSEDSDYESGHHGAYVQAWVWIDNPEDPKV